MFISSLRLTQTFSFHQVAECAALLLGHTSHCWLDGRTLSSELLRKAGRLFAVLHLTCALCQFHEHNLLLFFCADKLLGTTLGFLSLIYMDFRITLSLYTFEAVLLVYRFWALIGFDNVTPLIVFVSVFSHILCAATIALVEVTIKSNTAAKAFTGKKSTLKNLRKHGRCITCATF